MLIGVADGLSRPVVATWHIRSRIRWMRQVATTRTFLQGDIKVLERREGICLIMIRFEDTAIERCESRRWCPEPRLVPSHSAGVHRNWTAQRSRNRRSSVSAVPWLSPNPCDVATDCATFRPGFRFKVRSFMRQFVIDKGTPKYYALVKKDKWKQPQWRCFGNTGNRPTSRQRL